MLICTFFQTWVFHMGTKLGCIFRAVNFFNWFIVLDDLNSDMWLEVFKRNFHQLGSTLEHIFLSILYFFISMIWVYLLIFKDLYIVSEILQYRTRSWEFLFFRVSKRKENRTETLLWFISIAHRNRNIFDMFVLAFTQYNFIGCFIYCAVNIWMPVATHGHISSNIYNIEMSPAS